MSSFSVGASQGLSPPQETRAGRGERLLGYRRARRVGRDDVEVSRTTAANGALQN